MSGDCWVSERENKQTKPFRPHLQTSPSQLSTPLSDQPLLSCWLPLCRCSASDSLTVLNSLTHLRIQPCFTLCITQQVLLFLRTWLRCRIPHPHPLPGQVTSTVHPPSFPSSHRLLPTRHSQLKKKNEVQFSKEHRHNWKGALQVAAPSTRVFEVTQQSFPTPLGFPGSLAGPPLPHFILRPHPSPLISPFPA